MTGYLTPHSGYSRVMVFARAAVGMLNRLAPRGDGFRACVYSSARAQTMHSIARQTSGRQHAISHPKRGAAGRQYMPSGRDAADRRLKGTSSFASRLRPGGPAPTPGAGPSRFDSRPGSSVTVAGPDLLAGLRSIRCRKEYILSVYGRSSPAGATGRTPHIADGRT